MPNRCSRCGRGRSHTGLVLAFALAFALYPQPALAGQDNLSTAETLALADYLEYQDRPSEGRALVVELLKTDPENLQAQRWYIHSWEWFSEISRVELQYRAWLEAKPDDELRRLLLALAFAADRGRFSSFSSEDCVELEGLLEPLPKKDPERRFLALSTLNNTYRFNNCEGDVKKTEEEMLGLLDRSAYARQYYLHQLGGGTSGVQRLALLQRSYQDEPSTLIDALKLWDDSEMHAGTALQEGGEAPTEKSAEALGEEALGEARKHALKAARKALRSKRLSQINTAHRIFHAAGEDKAASRAVKLLLRLDPAWQDRSWLDDDRKAQRKIRQKLRGTKRWFDPGRRLEALDALGEEAESNDKARGLLLQARGQALADLGRTEEAVEEYRKAHEAMPDSHHMANSFAWEAALAGVQLDKALVAVEQALRLARAETWRRTARGMELEEWSRGRRRTEGAYLDTRAWILYKLDRYKEAEVAERAALRLHQSSELQRHMGLIYARLGDRHAAISHLAEGIRVDKTAQDPLGLEALEVFEELFEEAGYWHQDGPGGYLALVAQERKRKAEERKSRKTGGERGSTDDDRFVPGTQFPDLAYRTGDEEHKLSELKQTVVVDVWATWCRPCVEGLPHLNEIARQYKERGVTTLALSVGDKPEDAEEFFDPSDKIEFLRGWAGDKAMDTIGIKGIPAIFILDKDLKILGNFFGYGDGDRRIEDILDEVLEDND